MTSSFMNPLILSLMIHGNNLAGLLDKAKSRSNREIIHENVRKEVEDLLENLESPHQLPASFPETIIPKIIEKIQVTVQNFIKLDSDNAPIYETLTKKINDWKSKNQSSSSPSSAPELLGEFPTSVSTREYEASIIDDHRFEQLTDKQKMCLLCWSLFPVGVKIKKRELFFWWIGFDVIDDPLEGDNILAEFVEKEFIQRTTIGNKKLCNSYMMNEYVHSRVVNISNFGGTETSYEHSYWSIVTVQKGMFQQMSSSLVINNEHNNLNAEKFEGIIYCAQNVRVLHLGSWDHNPKRYIVLEDIESLKGLRDMRYLACLSLQGISGIVELPDSVYKLENLKILDLRACPNLESLSQGIKSLKQLTHLDLSECYLLDHIPRGLASLTKLRVLKGFVINPEDPHHPQVRDEGNKKKKKDSLLSTVVFSDLSNLKELIKLTIRTRRMDFPTIQDFDTLSAMEKLTVLGIFWVRSSAADPNATGATRFPKSLKKLELQAAPDNSLSCLLSSFSKDTENILEKLYIRGGQCPELDIEMHSFRNVHTVCLRYLPELTIYWDHFIYIFPNLTRLQVLECPNLIFFPCDENGVWVKA